MGKWGNEVLLACGAAPAFPPAPRPSSGGGGPRTASTGFCVPEGPAPADLCLPGAGCPREPQKLLDQDLGWLSVGRGAGPRGRTPRGLALGSQEEEAGAGGGSVTGAGSWRFLLLTPSFYFGNGECKLIF